MAADRRGAPPLRKPAVDVKLTALLQKGKASRYRSSSRNSISSSPSVIRFRLPVSRKPIRSYSRRAPSLFSKIHSVGASGHCRIANRNSRVPSPRPCSPGRMYRSSMQFPVTDTTPTGRSVSSRNTFAPAASFFRRYSVCRSTLLTALPSTR